MLYLSSVSTIVVAQTESSGSALVGDEVRTIGGIYGTIRSEDDETFTIDIGGGSTMRMAKRAIAERIGDDTE